jgi:peptidoglycan/LPS O-acetylase OafA/YrhL
LGFFRLLLACAVALAHGGIDRQFEFPYLSLVSNVHAVRMFFVVSGFYMALVLDTTYSNLPMSHFYTNRLLRLLPTYWIAALLFLAISFFGFSNSLPQNVAWWAPSAHYFDGHPVAFVYLVVTNICLIGQDLAAFISLNHGAMGHDFLIVPQAWSLGMELWFYMAAPFIVMLRSRSLLILILIGVALRLEIELSHLPSWPWNQRFLLTEYVYFLMGILSYRAMKADESTWTTSRAIGIVVLLFSPFIVFYVGWYDYGRELDAANSVFIGMIAALVVPVLFNSTKYSKIDRLLGEFSYPIYLTHLGIIMLYPQIKERPLLLLFAAFIASAIIVIFVERPIDRWRHLRTKRIAGAGVA